MRFDYDSRITRIAASLDEKMELALRMSAEAIAQSAQSRAPVASGKLRDSIHVEKIDEGYAVIAGDDDVYYGHMVENGTTRTPPRPFLIPAAEAERQHVLVNGRRVLSDL